MGSKLFEGRRPEEWSPLGNLDHAGVGRWIANEIMSGFLASHSVEIDSLSELPDQTPAVTLSIENQTIAVLSYYADAFALPAPKGINAIIISSDSIQDEIAARRIWPILSKVLDEGDPMELMLWRIYSGQNSWVRDALTVAKKGQHRIVMSGVGGAAFVVGRTVRIRAKNLGTLTADPFAPGRLAFAEVESEVEAKAENAVNIAKTCPNIREMKGKVDRTVIVVHGTMSTGIALAKAMTELIGGAGSVLRFEHDTWLKVSKNADELKNLVEICVSDSVVLVGHSRGGLVAALAGYKLQESGIVTVEHVYTLGTPFYGTPVALLPDVGIVGLRALMGLLRYAGGPMVDVTTRIMSLALRVQTPPGIAAMHPQTDFLDLLREVLPKKLTAFSGAAVEDNSIRYGLIAGFSVGVFKDDSNDLVVSSSSSAAGPQPVHVECDHFSYLEQEIVKSDLSGRLSAFLAHANPPLTW